MENIIFQDTVNILLQGNNALNYILSNEKVVQFELNGFISPKIILNDYRPKILDSVNHFFKTNDNSSFLREFSKTASIYIYLDDYNNLILNLFKTEFKDIDKYLWLAVGLKESIPAYEYLFRSISSFNNENTFSIASVIKP